MLCEWKNSNTWLWEACCLIQASCSQRYTHLSRTRTRYIMNHDSISPYVPSYFRPHISRPGAGHVISRQDRILLRVGSRQSLPRQSDRCELKNKCHWLLPFSGTPWHHQITINIYQHLSTNLQFAGNRNLMSLSIMVHHCLVYAIVFLCLPPRGSRQPRWIHLSLPTASLAARSRPSIKGDWIDTRRSLGLVRDTGNDLVVLLGCGSLKKVAAMESKCFYHRPLWRRSLQKAMAKVGWQRIFLCLCWQDWNCAESKWGRAYRRQLFAMLDFIRAELPGVR